MGLAEKKTETGRSGKSKAVTVVAVCVIAATILTVATVLLIRKNKRPPAETAPTEYAYEAFSVDPASASAVSFTQNGKTVSLRLENGTWILSDDSEMPIDTAAVRERLERLVSLKSSIRYTETTETQKQEFGLTPPALSVTVTDGAYGTRTLHFGKFSAVAGGYYITTSADENTVYIADEQAFGAFGGTVPSDLLRTETFPVISAGTLDGFDLTVNGNTYKFSFDIRGVEKEGKTYYWFVCVNGDPSIPVDTDADELCSLILYPDYEKLLTWHTSDFGKYGIGEDSPTLTVHYTETVTVSAEDGNRYERRSYSVSLRFGETADDLTDYVNPQGTTTVYSLCKKGLLNDLLSVANGCR